MKKVIKYKNTEGEISYYASLKNFMEINKDFEPYKKAIKSYIHRKGGDAAAPIWGKKKGIEIQSVSMDCRLCVITENGAPALLN